MILEIIRRSSMGESDSHLTAFLYYTKRREAIVVQWDVYPYIYSIYISKLGIDYSPKNLSWHTWKHFKHAKSTQWSDVGTQLRGRVPRPFSPRHYNHEILLFFQCYTFIASSAVVMVRETTIYSRRMQSLCVGSI